MALRSRLSVLYAEPLPRNEKLARREEIFSWGKRRYRHLFPEHPHATFLRRPLNNAVVLSHGRYLSGVPFHRRIYRCLHHDLAALVALYKRAQAFDDPLRWAAQRCHLPPQTPPPR